jgi:hypothetical protein
VYRNAVSHLVISKCAEGLCTHLWRLEYCIKECNACVHEIVHDNFDKISTSLELRLFADTTQSEVIKLIRSTFTVWYAFVVCSISLLLQCNRLVIHCMLNIIFRAVILQTSKHFAVVLKHVPFLFMAVTYRIKITCICTNEYC